MSDVEANHRGDDCAEPFRGERGLGSYSNGSWFNGSPRSPDSRKTPAVSTASIGSVAQTPGDRSVVYVTYFCGVEQSSLAAAIRDGLARLAAYVALHAELRPGAPIVRYRNWRGTTVTVDVGLPVEPFPELHADGNVKLGHWNRNYPLALHIDGSVDDLITGLSEAISQRQAQKLVSRDSAWQSELRGAPALPGGRSV